MLTNTINSEFPVLQKGKNPVKSFSTSTKLLMLADDLANIIFAIGTTQFYRLKSFNIFHTCAISAFLATATMGTSNLNVTEEEARKSAKSSLACTATLVSITVLTRLFVDDVKKEAEDLQKSLLKLFLVSTASLYARSGVSMHRSLERASYFVINRNSTSNARTASG